MDYETHIRLLVRQVQLLTEIQEQMAADIETLKEIAFQQEKENRFMRFWLTCLNKQDHYDRVYVDKKLQEFAFFLPPDKRPTMRQVGVMNPEPPAVTDVYEADRV